jgi:son of sevenless-like protein
MMFKQFMTTQELIERLVGRFFLHPPSNLLDGGLKVWMDKKQTPIRLRVYNALKSLLEGYWPSNEPTELLLKLQQSAQTDMAEAMPTIASRLSDIITKTIAAPSGEKRNKMKGPTSFDGFPTSIIPKNLAAILGRQDPAVFLMEVDPLEIARQLTILDSRIFCEIQDSELMNQDWTKNKRNNNSHVTKSSKLSTQLTGWIVTIILSESDLKKRALLLKQVIKLGDVLKLFP